MNPAATNLLFLVILVGAFYFLIMRPSRARQRAALQLRERLAPGARIMTTAGLYATVVSVDDEDNAVVLETSPGVTSRWARAAVARVLEEDDSAEATEGAAAVDLRKDSSGA